MKGLTTFMGFLLMLGATSLPAHARLIQGRVHVLGRPAAGSNAATIVYAEPLDSHSAVRPGRFTMAQRNKTFIPHALVVPVGSTVDFPNQDLIFHNVFSLSRPYPFDLGLYRAGASKSQTFTLPATYRLFCNIHPQMSAVIVVVPTSFIAETAADGRYQLDLPRGRYRLTAWSERSQPVTAELTASDSTTTAPEIGLDESHYVELPHKNKYGQDYPASAYETMRTPGMR